MNRTLIYARVSTEDQVEKYGLPSQLRACRELAARSGLAVTEEIADEGVSGAILDRPGLNRVRQLVAAGEADIVLSFDADRLSRELAHLLILKPEIERRARLEFVAAKFEDSPSGNMFFGIRGVIAQYERAVTRERTMRGKRERASAGLIPGGRTAYGYRYEAGRLIPDAAGAAAVRNIYAWYEAGVSIRGIAQRLRESGVPTWGNRKWGHSSVRRILLNETYAGVAHYGTHRREGNLIKVRQSVERIALIVPALVPRELWDRAQARQAQHFDRKANPSVGRPSSRFLLRGLLYCECGKKMSAESGRGYRYRCTGRDAESRGPLCHASTSATVLDGAVWGELVRAFTGAGFVSELLRESRAGLQAGGGAERVDDLQRLERKARLKVGACIAALVDPDLAGSREAIKAEHRKAQGEALRHGAELAALEQAHRAAVSQQEWLGVTVELLRGYVAELKDAALRQEFVRGLCDRAEWRPGSEEVEMTCFLSPNLGQSLARSAQFTPGSERLKVVLTVRLAA